MQTSKSTITINKPAKYVWEALIQPELIKQWQYGSQLTTSWKIGEPIKFHNEWQGQSFDQWGKVLEYEPNSKIKYSLFAPRPDLKDVPENYFYMTYLLDQNVDSTILTIIQDDPRPSLELSDDSDAGNAILNSLKQLVEQAQGSN